MLIMEETVSFYLVVISCFILTHVAATATIRQDIEAQDFSMRDAGHFPVT